MNEKIKLKGQLNKLVKWPVYLTALLVILNILVYLVNIKAGLVVSAGVVVYIFVCVGLFAHQKPGIIKDLIGFANQYDLLQKKILDELALPYAIVDMDGKMIWSNKMFAQITGKDQSYKKHISTVFPEITSAKLPKKEEQEISEVNVSFGDRIYRVSMQRVLLGEVISQSEIIDGADENTSLIALYLYDETELREYIQKNEDNKLVVALAYLDNYEEALESVEDVRRSLLIALIDRKITKYFSNYDGVVRKLEKDKYFLVMRQSSLEALREQKFHILEEVKTVNIGNEMNVTLSIGIGLNAPTYLQN